MNTCPVCGNPIPPEETVCPACGASQNDASLHDPFAAAMAQEQKVRAAQDSMREKYNRTDLQPTQDPAALIAETASPTETEQPEPDAASDQPRKNNRSVWRYTAVFCAVLALAGCGAYFLGNRNAASKSKSYAFYAKDDDLWFYEGAKRKKTLLSENNLPENPLFHPIEIENDPEYSKLQPMDFPLDQDYYYQSLSHYDPESRCVWYPADYRAEDHCCSLMYRDLSRPESEYKITDIPLFSLNLMQRAKTGSFVVSCNQLDSRADQTVDNQPPCIFLGNTLYYINTKQQLCRWEAGTETVIAEHVYRYWTAPDSASVLYLQSEDNHAEQEISSGIHIIQIPYEEAAVPCALFRVKNEESPSILAMHLTSWSIPEKIAPRYFHYTVSDGNFTHMLQYDLEQDTQQVLQSALSEENWRVFLLRCYPDGSCYFGCKAALPGELIKSAIGLDPEATHRSIVNQPKDAGIWYYDHASGTSENLFQLNEGSPDIINVLLPTCQTKPYLIHSTGTFNAQLYCKAKPVETEKAELNAVFDAVTKDNLDDAFRLSHCFYQFAPSGNALLCFAENSFSIVDANADDDIDAELSKAFQDSRNYKVFEYLLHDDRNADFNRTMPYAFDGYTYYQWYGDPEQTENTLVGINGKHQLFSDAGNLNGVIAEDYQSYPAFGTAFAITDSTQNKHTLQMLRNYQWQPLADHVCDYEQIAQNGIYLYTQPDPDNPETAALQYYTIAEGMTYTADTGITALLCANSFE